MLWGAGGAGAATNPDYFYGSAFAGGSGGFTACSLSVSGGQELYVIVGGGGLAPAAWGGMGPGGYGGGGTGYVGDNHWAFGGGGGRSAIQSSIGIDNVTAGGGGG